MQRSMGSLLTPMGATVGGSLNAILCCIEANLVCAWIGIPLSMRNYELPHIWEKLEKSELGPIVPNWAVLAGFGQFG